jgi:hypothetical protein
MIITLIPSILLSVVLSIVLTIALNLFLHVMLAPALVLGAVAFLGALALIRLLKPV